MMKLNLILILLISTNIFGAYDIRDSRYPMDPKLPSNFNYYLSFDLLGKYGGIQSDDNTLIQDSTLFGMGGSASLGFTYLFLKAGAGYDYTSFGQSTEASEVGNVNTSGTAKGPYWTLGLKLGRFEFAYKKHTSYDYSFENKNSLGAETSLSVIENSKGLQLTYFLSKNFTLGLTYNTFTFSTYESPGNSRKLTDSEKVKLSEYGLLLGIFF